MSYEEYVDRFNQLKAVAGGNPAGAAAGGSEGGNAANGAEQGAAEGDDGGGGREDGAGSGLQLAIKGSEGGGAQQQAGLDGGQGAHGAGGSGPNMLAMGEDEYVEYCQRYGCASLPVLLKCIARCTALLLAMLWLPPRTMVCPFKKRAEMSAFKHLDIQTTIIFALSLASFFFLPAGSAPRWACPLMPKWCARIIELTRQPCQQASRLQLQGEKR
jgi:hypothetical protein